MTQEQIERNREFIKDLRANKKKAIGSLRNSSGGRCCLGVALDTAVRLGFLYDEKNELNDETIPPLEMGYWYGWNNSNPHIGSGKNISSAAAYNDGTSSLPSLSHEKIADLFEERFPEIKPETTT